MEARFSRAGIAVLILVLALTTAAWLRATTPALAASDLSITVTDSPDPVPAGSLLSYVVTVTNGGPDVATNTTFTFNYDPLLIAITSDFDLGSVPFNVVAIPNGAQGTIPTMNAGQFARVTFIFQVPGFQPVGTVLASSGTVTPSVPDLNPGNNTQAVTTTTSARLPGADVRVTILPGVTPFQPGRSRTFSIAVDNVGPDPATNVVLTVPVPTNSTFTSFARTSGAAFTVVPSDGTSASTATIANLPVFGEGRFTLTFVVGNAAGANVVGSASVATGSADPNPANNNAQNSQAIISQAPDQKLTIVDAPDPVNAGNNITYTINLSNGANTVQSAVTTFPIPPNTTFVSARQVSGAQVFTVAGPIAGNVTFSKANFSANNAVVLEVVVMVNAGTAGGTVVSGTATATSTTNGGEGEATPADNTATTTTTVAGGVVVPEPTATPTPSPTGNVGNVSNNNAPVATATPTPVIAAVGPGGSRVPPQVFQNQGAIGAIMQAGNHPPPPPRPAAVLAASQPSDPIVIRPPSTGDAGLR